MPESLHSAITIRARGSLKEARAALEGVDGLIELRSDGDEVLVRIAAFTPAEDAAKQWLRGGKEEEQAPGTPWRRKRGHTDGEPSQGQR